MCVGIHRTRIRSWIVPYPPSNPRVSSPTLAPVPLHCHLLRPDSKAYAQLQQKPQQDLKLEDHLSAAIILSYCFFNSSARRCPLCQSIHGALRMAASSLSPVIASARSWR